MIVSVVASYDLVALTVGNWGGARYKKECVTDRDEVKIAELA